MTHFNKDKISAIYFGLFSSNSWATTRTYKLTENFLFIDKSESYWSSRFTKNGYTFLGDKLDLEENKFAEITSLLGQVPSDIFEIVLPKNSDPGNKEEYTIFIQVDTKDGKSLQFKIDEYDNTSLAIDKNILEFKDNIKKVINKIQS
jgi:hypothetical protein